MLQKLLLDLNSFIYCYWLTLVGFLCLNDILLDFWPVFFSEIKTNTAKIKKIHRGLLFSRQMFYLLGLMLCLIETRQEFKNIFLEYSFIMNKHNQKPIDTFKKQDVTVYLTNIQILKS